MVFMVVLGVVLCSGMIFVIYCLIAVASLADEQQEEWFLAHSTTCPRCGCECPELSSNKHFGTIYECYCCKVDDDNPLRWYWESAQMWEPIHLEDPQPEEGMVKVIMTSRI